MQIIFAVFGVLGLLMGVIEFIGVVITVLQEIPADGIVGEDGPEPAVVTSIAIRQILGALYCIFGLMGLGFAALMRR